MQLDGCCGDPKYRMQTVIRSAVPAAEAMRPWDTISNVRLFYYIYQCVIWLLRIGLICYQ
jgi:hypothetical protein